MKQALSPVKSRVLAYVLCLFIVGFVARLFFHWYSFSTLEENMSRCTILPESQEYHDCLRAALKNKVSAATIPYIMGLLPRVARTNQDPSGVFSCHNVAHVAGDLASRGKDDTASLISACGNACKYGCVHAVILGRMRADPSLLNDPDAICTTGLQKNNDLLNCYHGLGHVFAEYSGYDITTALTKCDAISQGAYQEDCAGGIFMEVFQPPLLNHPAQTPPTSPLVFCSTMPQKYKQYCVIDYAILQYQNTQNIQEGVAYCNTLSALGAERCGEVLGHAVYEHAYGQTDQIIQTCTQAKDLFIPCLTGVSQESLKFDQSGKRTRELCDKLSREGLHVCEDVLREIQENK